MKKTMLKRILGLFILIFVFTFISLPNVAAAEPKLCTKVSDVDWAARYGIELDYDGTYYIITMNVPEATVKAGVDKKKAKFKVTGIVNYTPTFDGKKDGKDIVSGSEKKDKAVLDYIETPKDGILKDGGTVKIKKSKLGYSKPGIEISLDPYKPDEFVDPTVKAKCGDGYTFHEDVGFESEGDPDTSGKMDDQWKVIEKDLEISQAIDCSNWQSGDKISFKYGFCQAKTGATKEHTYEFAKDELYNQDKTEEFKCNPNHLVVPENLANVDDDTYYKNRKYMYGSTIKTVKTVTYRHHYENGAGVDNTDKAVCKLKCEEAVTVEYGPPIASKAAFCFQYKVKVTSRVSCAQGEGMEVKVPREDNYCTPSPYCVHSNGTVYKQGGPNEEFDACVKTCDGGKYTSKCTKKCYNKVYGKSKNKVSKTSDDFASEVQVKRLNGNDKTIDCSTCGDACPNNHYCYDGSQIIWKNGANGGARNCNTGNHTSGNWYSCSTDSRWHQNNSWGCSGGYSRYSATGIPRTATCSDVCSWIGCKSGKYYLNPDSLNEDAKYNQEQYEELVRECKAAASCTNKTAYFTISVDYKNGKGETLTIDFPYSNAKVTKNDKKFNIVSGDQLTSKGKGEETGDTSGDDNTTLIKNKLCTTANLNSKSKTWIRHYCTRGCYEADSEKDLYRAEWTFPGTWENLKSGEISYKKLSGGSWKERPKYFCVPADAQNVNTNWWIYYYSKNYKNDTRFAYNVKDYTQKIEDGKCDTTCSYTFKNIDGMKESDIKDWNIRALARGFGYFAWNIDIKCFYALNDQKKTPIGTCRTKTCRSEEDYRIRSVDLKNLFPSKSGAAVSYDTTGRSPGYNWSAYATQTTKDTVYKSQPSEYTKWVQKKGYAVYEDKNLDYAVTIDKDSIQAIKNHIKSSGINGKDLNYTKFDGDVSVSSTAHYRSKLFTSSDTYKLKKVVYPDDIALKCNNIGEHTNTGAGYSASCQNY